MICTTYFHHMCSCRHTVDFTCSHVYRNAFFHRLNNCVLPMLRHLNETFVYGDCLLAESHVVFPFAQLMSHVLHPTSTLRLYALSTRWNRASHALVTQRHPCRTHAIQAHQSSPHQSWKVLARLTASMGDQTKAWQNVLVTRLRTRRFLEEDELFRALSGSATDPWVRYDGSASLRMTVLLFSRAQHVVGFHGAGLLNALFSRHPRPHVHEISTFIDTDSRLKWRHYVGRIARRWNGAIRVTTQFIPLPRLLRVNAGFDPRVHALKNIRWVSLTTRDVRAIVNVTS